MLPSDYLVPPGDWSAMSAKVIDLLKDRDVLARARWWAKQRSRQFCWKSIAQTTSDVYTKHWKIKMAVQSEVASQV
jgi:glycosyltransferase involved in cell wall biosynthesis